MKTIYTVPLFALFFVAQSCNKNNSTPGSGKTDSIRIAVTYQDTSSNAAADFELVAQEPGGKILLDTLAPVNTPIIATLRTTDPLVNIATVYMGLHDTAYTVNAYLGVDPSGWQVIPWFTNFSVLPGAAHGAVHQTYVENIPGLDTVTGPDFIDYAWFSDHDIPINFLGINTYSNSILLNGNFYSDKYLYTLIPSLGLYNFHVPDWSRGTDTVDLSHMDTTVNVNFPRHPPFTSIFCELDGFMDTTDLSNNLKLYFTSYMHSSYDLEYPAKYVQKYQLRASFAAAADSTSVSYYSYGNGISTNFSFPDPSQYSFPTAPTEDFYIHLNGLNPTYFLAQWKLPKINFYIYGAPDTAVVHPQALITALNSQKLTGLGVMGITPVNAFFQTVDQMNYAAFMHYVSNPVGVGQHVRSAVGVARWY